MNDGASRSKRPSGPRRSEKVRGKSQRSPSRKGNRPNSLPRSRDLKPLRAPRVEPLTPPDVEAKMLPGKMRAELLSLSAENAEVVAKQLVMIDRLLSSGDPADMKLAQAFGQAASNRAGRVGVVRRYAGRAALANRDFVEAKRHLSAAFRIVANPFDKVLMAECESGLGRHRKALELLGEVKTSSLSKREVVYAHIVSGEARERLGQIDAARVTLTPRLEAILAQTEVPTTLEHDHNFERLRKRWFELKARLVRD